MELREWMRINGMSQQEFGAKLRPPASQGKVNHWLAGTRRVSLAEALHISIEVTGGAVSLQELAAMYRGPAAAEPAANDGAAPSPKGCDDTHVAA